MKKLELVADRNGRLLLDAEVLETTGLKDAEVPVVLSLTEGKALVFDDRNKGASQMLYAELPIVDLGDLLSAINRTHKTGVVTLREGQIEKTLFFKSGELSFASSTNPDDRLGNTLWRNGMISRENLDMAVELMEREHLRLGEAIMKVGEMTPRDIYVGLSFQVRDIFLSTFEMFEAVFVFVERDLHERNEMRLKDSTAALIREGIERSDEMSRLRVLIPDLATTFSVKETVGEDVDSREKAVLAMAKRDLTFREIMSGSGLGEYDCYRVVGRLVREGFLVPVVEGESNAAGTSRLDTLLDALSTCYVSLRDKGPMGAAHFGSYLENPPSHGDLLGGLQVLPNGRLDKTVILERAIKSYGASGPEVAEEALDNLLQYVLFEVKNALAPDEAQAVLVKILSSI